MNLDFEVSTLEKLQKFRSTLINIRQQYPNIGMATAREYLINGTRIQGVPDEYYSLIDELYKIRMEVLTIEKEHILAQSKMANTKVPEGVFEGKNLAPFFEKNLYEKIPTLAVIEFLGFYSKEEVVQMSNGFGLDKQSENIEDER